jgi:hypothetical protein
MTDGPQTYQERNSFEIAPPIDSEYTALPIKDSLRLLVQFDDTIRLGLGDPPTTLHPWQLEVNEDLSYGRTRIDGEIVKERKPTSLHPYKYALCAANGSGKDAFVIAPFALFCIVSKIKCKVIITSASGTQLSTQTEHYIRELARSINKHTKAIQGYEILKINQRHVYCKSSGSVIHMFATDEGEKAEGHHPISPGCEMVIIVNEAKSVSPEIFNALKRCTGFNYWINVSSPGEPRGEFHKAFQNWPNKKRVTYFDCPHQSPEEFEEDRKDMGEYSPLFRSKWLALFTYVGGRYVISKEKLDHLLELNKRELIPAILQDKPIKIGIDIALSSNGDETVISIWKGNKQIAQYTYRIQDSTLLAAAMSKDLLKHVPKNHPHIFGDDGGVGRSVIDIMNRMGWKINRVLNNSTKNCQKGFRNRGAQTWYKVHRLIEEAVLIFKDLKDKKLFEQLESRKYKETDAGIDKMTLEPKKDMISQGLPSPDRADAMVLAFTDCRLSEFLDKKDYVLRIPEPAKTKEEQYQTIKYSLRRNLTMGDEDSKPSFKNRIFGSIHSALRR